MIFIPVSVDQRMDKFTTATKSNKWTRKLLSYMLDVSRTNAQTVLAKNKGMCPRKSDSADFMYKLAVQLVMPQVLQRKSLKYRFLPTEIKKTMDYFMLINNKQMDQNHNDADMANLNEVQGKNIFLLAKIFSD